MGTKTPALNSFFMVFIAASLIVAYVALLMLAMAVMQSAKAFLSFAGYLNPFSPCLINSEAPAPSEQITGVPADVNSTNEKLNMSQVDGTNPNLTVCCKRAISGFAKGTSGRMNFPQI